MPLQLGKLAVDLFTEIRPIATAQITQENVMLPIIPKNLEKHGLIVLGREIIDRLNSKELAEQFFKNQTNTII